MIHLFTLIWSITCFWIRIRIFFFFFSFSPHLLDLFWYDIVMCSKVFVFWSSLIRREKKVIRIKYIVDKCLWCFIGFNRQVLLCQKIKIILQHHIISFDYCQSFSIRFDFGSIWIDSREKFYSLCSISVCVCVGVFGLWLWKCSNRMLQMWFVFG